MLGTIIVASICLTSPDLSARPAPRPLLKVESLSQYDGDIVKLIEQSKEFLVKLRQRREELEAKGDPADAESIRILKQVEQSRRDGIKQLERLLATPSR